MRDLSTFLLDDRGAVTLEYVGIAALLAGFLLTGAAAMFSSARDRQTFASTEYATQVPSAVR